SSPTHIEDVRRAPTDVLSFHDALNDIIFVDAMFGVNMTGFHISIIRSHLTRQLPAVFPNIWDELCKAFEDHIPLQDGEWTKVPAAETMAAIVARATSRLFVGYPLCRNKEYLKLITDYTAVVSGWSNLIRTFPPFLRRVAARMLSPLPATLKKLDAMLGPVVEERRQQLKMYRKEWDGKPEDLITWTLETGSGEELEHDNILRRMLRFNFAAIHTTSRTLSFALFHLASEHMKYLSPLRAEIEAIVSVHGWTKESIDKMSKLDSFIRESHRHHGLATTNMFRKARSDFTFSDGTRVPKGTHLAVAAIPRQIELGGGEEFDGFRFAHVDGEEESEEAAKHKFVSIGMNYLSFGLGRNACPGRFWASNEIKTMLAYMVYNFDIRMEYDGVLPEPRWIGITGTPDPTACLMLRKRRDV
ncbi:cytochrome P450, partial [Exidia glandulosa HHB12029]